MKILIVDDSLTIRTFLKSLLNQVVPELMRENESLTVFEADRGTTAIQLCEESIPDVIFLDIHMPEMDGVEVLNKVRRLPASKQTPVIMVSSDTDPHQMDRCRNGGAFGFVKKPFKAKAIKSALKAALKAR